MVVGVDDEGIDVEVEDDGVGVGLKGMFAGMVTVCVLLQSLVSPLNTQGKPVAPSMLTAWRPIYPIIACTWISV